MLTNPSSQNDHTCLFRSYGHVVQSSDIADDVNDESWVLVGVEVNHVA
jgi:hypothetical protein